MKKKIVKDLSYKAFSPLILCSLLCILICVALFPTGTYAWFSDGIQSSKSTLQTSGTCLLSASVYKDGAEEATVSVGSSAVLNGRGSYTVTVTLPSGSASGYLVLKTADGEYFTDCLEKSEVEDQTLSFTLNIQAEKNVTLEAYWGVYSGEGHVNDGGVLDIE